MGALSVIVYKLTNNSNGMSYIGATIRPLPLRLSDHSSAAKRGKTTLIAQAIREVGIEAFSAEILDTAETYDELMMKEIGAIKEHGTLAPSGYNRSSGGRGTPDCRLLESTRLKIAEKAKGRPVSVEARAKISAFFKGRPNPKNVGRGAGKPAWNRGLKASPETREKLREHWRTHGRRTQRVIEFEGVSYPSIVAATKATGLSVMQIKYRLQTGRARYLDR